MTYYVARDGRRYGPYTLSQMQSMMTEGNVQPADLAWAEGMPAWVPAFQVVSGTAVAQFQPSVQPPVAASAAAVAPAPTQVPPQPYLAPAARAQPGVMPPELHWALVLLFGVLTLGVFFLVWMFMQAGYVKRIDPGSNATVLLAIWLGLIVVGVPLSVIGIGLLLILASHVVFYIAVFSMRQSMLTYFNGAEPIGLRLSGVMTFFFHQLYFQHHMTRIANWRRTGWLL